MKKWVAVGLFACFLGACVETRGTAWMAQPLSGDDPSWATGPLPSGDGPAGPSPRPPGGAPARSGPPAAGAAPGVGGMALGVFRNTYYDFPSEADHKGAMTKIFSASCAPIAEVPRGFHDAVCVQGSGQLKNGTTVSFARRDCECAEVCPRSGQKICFEALDRAQFPWGRGSTGKPIKPLFSVAVDPAVIPLGTAIYLPEYDGVPRDEEGGALHDGCFLAQDRGSRVVGNHIDIFTGSERSTVHWNSVVPSNKGVTVVVNAPRCLRLAAGNP